jgi:hypothetical protein
MRALLVAVLVAATLWAGYWIVGSRAMERAATDWFADQQGTPLLAQRSGLSVAGFPNRFDLTVTEPRLTETRSGIGWQAPFAQVFMMSWKPWHLIATLPQTQTITLPGQDITLTSTLAQGSLVLVPGTDLTLDRTAIAGDGIALTSTAGWQAAAASVRFGTRRAPDSATAQEVALDLTTLTPDATFRAALAPLSDLPEQIDLIRVDSVLGLTAPIDRHAAGTRPALTDLRLREGLLRWGDLVISARGDLTAAADGTPEGRIEIRVEQWRKLIPVLIAAGLLTPENAQSLTRALDLYAQQGSDPDTLTVPMLFTKGLMSLGPLPLGPAPAIFQRQ